MTTVQIVCRVCSALVDVVDKTIAAHGNCIASGLRYVPSQVFKAGPGAPSIEVIGAHDLKMQCPNEDGCGETHSGSVAIIKVSPGTGARGLN